MFTEHGKVKKMISRKINLQKQTRHKINKTFEEKKSHGKRAEKELIKMLQLFSKRFERERGADKDASIIL